MGFKVRNSIPDKKNECVYLIIKRVLELQKIEERPFFIGISGAGGAGKTTFANNLTRFIGERKSLAIDLDDCLISREERGKLEITGYNPLANRLSMARKNIEELSCKQSIMKPRYDHSTGKVLPDEQLKSKSVIIIEGVTTFYPELNELYDLGFFLDASDETQIKSRINRDVNERGYSLEEALALYKAVQPDYLKP